jgi:hypothetical protein
MLQRIDVSIDRHPTPPVVELPDNVLARSDSRQAQKSA